MPLYEYKCDCCGTKFSKLISLSEKKVLEKNIKCEKCGSKNLKLISNVGILNSKKNSGANENCCSSACKCSF